MTTPPTDPSSQQAPDSAPPARMRRFVWLRVIGSLALLAIVLWFVGKQLRQDFREIPWNDVHIQPLNVGLAMGVFLLVRILNGLNIRLLLAAMGVSVPTRKVLPIAWVAAIGRYIPGKVAVVGGSLLMLVRVGVRLPLAMAALFLATALTMLTGLMSAVPLLFTTTMRQQWSAGPVVAIVSLAIGLVCLFPPIFLRLCNQVMRLLKRPPLPGRIRLIPFSAAIGLTSIRICLLGVCLWLSARTFMPLPLAQLPYTIAVAGLAGTIGFLAVFAPAGLGVHERIFQIAMEPLMGPQASLLAVIMRVFNLLADVIMAGVGLAMRANAKTPEVLPLDATVPADAA